MSSDSDDYDANNLNNTTEKPKPRKRKRTNNTEDRVNSSVESSDFHAGHQVLLSLYNYNGKFQTNLHQNQLREAFHQINNIFGFELTQTDSLKKTKTQFVRNTLSDPTWSHEEVIHLMTKSNTNQFHDSQLSQIGKFSLIIMILYREGVDASYSMEKKDLRNFVKNLLPEKEFNEVIKEMIRLEYINTSDEKYSLGGKCKESRPLSDDEKANEKEPRFNKEISLESLVMKCNEIDAAE